MAHDEGIHHMPVVRPPARTVPELEDDLARCQRDLADARAELENLAEQAAKIRRRLAKSRARITDLALVLDTYLQQQTRRRARSWWPLRSDKVSAKEWEEARLVRTSKLWDPVYYLRQNPDVIAEREDPALHFVRVGYRAGLDPSPDFSIRHYLLTYPELEKSGENPLLHHLRTRGASARR